MICSRCLSSTWWSSYSKEQQLIIFSYILITAMLPSHETSSSLMQDGISTDLYPPQPSISILPEIEQSSNLNQECYYTCDFSLAFVSLLTFVFLYLSLQSGRATYFVVISMLANAVYPIYRKVKNPGLSLEQIIVEGTFLTSLLYDIWTLVFPHKVFIYYIPQMVGAIGKIYHVLSWQADQQIVQQLVKYQSRTQLVVIVYSIIGLVIKLKYTWFKLAKMLLLASIVRLKYSVHYGTVLTYHQLQLRMDRLARTLSMRRLYHQIYIKVITILVVGEEIVPDVQYHF